MFYFESFSLNLLINLVIKKYFLCALLQYFLCFSIFLYAATAFFVKTIDFFYWDIYNITRKGEKNENK